MIWPQPRSVRISTVLCQPVQDDLVLSISVPTLPHNSLHPHRLLVVPWTPFPSVSVPRSALCLGDSAPKVFVGLDPSPPLRRPPPDSHSVDFIPLFLF